MAMYKAKRHVTFDTLYQKLKEKIATRQSGWKWCQTTLYNFLTIKMNYAYTSIIVN